MRWDIAGIALTALFSQSALLALPRPGPVQRETSDEDASSGRMRFLWTCFYTTSFVLIVHLCFGRFLRIQDSIVESVTSFESVQDEPASHLYINQDYSAMQLNCPKLLTFSQYAILSSQFDNLANQAGHSSCSLLSRFQHFLVIGKRLLLVLLC